MNPDTALLIAAASGVFALLGSLGSQLIGALANLRAKRMELVYSRKLEAYQGLIGKACALAEDISSGDKYSEFYRAFLGATTVASDRVFDIMANQEKGLYRMAQKAHEAKVSDGVDLTSYTEVVNSFALAARKDLKRFSGK